MKSKMDSRKREDRYRRKSSSSSSESDNERKDNRHSGQRKSRFRNDSDSDEHKGTRKIKHESVSDDDNRDRRGDRGSTSRNSGHNDHRPSKSRFNYSRDRRRSRSPPDFKSRSIKLEKEEKEVWGKPNKDETKPKISVNKAKPDFGLSGKLAEETNTYNGVVIKYSEPPEARKPKRRWRLYPFKGDQGLPTLYIHRQSAFLIGRDRKVADLPIDHPSCSKQHAALQYRLVPYTRPNGFQAKRISPYIIDLESANGTFVNNKQIEPKKYVELLEKDVIKFGFSSREYVLLHEHSKDSDDDDNCE